MNGVRVVEPPRKTAFKYSSVTNLQMKSAKSYTMQVIGFYTKMTADNVI